MLEKRGISVNLLSYVGLGTVRELVIGDGNRKPTADELQKMQGIVTAAMQQGAEGVSTGLIYPPNAYADLDELVALSTPAAAMGGRYASHLRHDGKRLRDGIEEAIAIGERAKIPVHVFHIKVTGQQNFGRMKEVIELVEAAQARGVKVTADVYPYVASSTSLTATLPQWVMDGGTDKLVERLSDRATRARIKRDMEDPNATWDNRYQSAGTWANVQLASIGRRRGLPSDTENPHAKYEGMRVADAAKAAGKDPFEFVFDLLRDTRGGVSCVYFIMSEDDVKLALRQPWVGVGSDGSALAIEGPLRAGVPHPRNFGTFPRVLGKYVREEQVIALEEAIRKMTSLPAATLGLTDRGSIAAGKWADLVIFDPATVADRATFEEPFQYPVGIDMVIVNGQVVLDEGQHTNAPRQGAAPPTTVRRHRSSAAGPRTRSAISDASGRLSAARVHLSCSSTSRRPHRAARCRWPRRSGRSHGSRLTSIHAPNPAGNSADAAPAALAPRHATAWGSGGPGSGRMGSGEAARTAASRPTPGQVGLVASTR